MHATAWTADQVLGIRPDTPMRATCRTHGFRESRRPEVIKWVRSRRADWTVANLAEHTRLSERTCMDWIYAMIDEGYAERVREGRGGHRAIYRTVR